MYRVYESIVSFSDWDNLQCYYVVLTCGDVPTGTPVEPKPDTFNTQCKVFSFLSLNLLAQMPQCTKHTSQHH